MSVTQDLGPLRFSADSFLRDGTTYTVRGGQVVLGFVPRGTETYTGLLNLDLSSFGPPGTVEFDTSAEPLTFKIVGGAIDSIVQGGTTKLIEMKDAATAVTFKVDELTGANGSSIPADSAGPFSVARVAFTLGTLAIAEPVVDGEIAPQVLMQGSITFPKFDNWDLSKLKAYVDGANHVKADVGGISLDGVRVGVTGDPFSAFGMDASTVNLGLG